MSSPISSLKKGKRTPLDPRQAQVPFRHHSSTQGDPIDEIPNAFLRKDVLSRLPRTSASINAPSDKDLLSSMISRLAQVEQQLKVARTQLQEKDKKIHILEEKAKLLEKARGYNSGTITELEKKCRSLQNQVFQMEDFLADYGMVWVGDNGADFDKYDVLEEEPSSVSQSLSKQDGIWKPDSSLVTSAAQTFSMDFDLVLKNIAELNIIAGEGCSVVSRTKDGARLKVSDSVPLTLYKNGIFMFGGPFRPYSDPITQQCMQDIMDGFFPTELQNRYPEGVAFEVHDKRDVMFEDKRTALLFPGTGQTLSDNENSSETQKVESQAPTGAAINKQSVGQFLARLPQSTIKDGKIIDVRSGIADVIKGGVGQSDVKVLDTLALQEIKSRSADGHRPQSGLSQITTLRIKSETGETTFIVKMKFTETVGDVRRYIDNARQTDAPPYEIKTSFPNRVYSNPTETLEDCGLVPNATLHLLVKKS